MGYAISRLAGAIEGSEELGKARFIGSGELEKLPGGF